MSSEHNMQGDAKLGYTVMKNKRAQNVLYLLYKHIVLCARCFLYPCVSTVVYMCVCAWMCARVSVEKRLIGSKLKSSKCYVSILICILSHFF